MCPLSILLLFFLRVQIKNVLEEVIQLVKTTSTKEQDVNKCFLHFAFRLIRFFFFVKLSIETINESLLHHILIREGQFKYNMNNGLPIAYTKETKW